MKVKVFKIVLIFNNFFGNINDNTYLALIFTGMEQRLKYRFMMNRLGRRLYHCLMFYNI